MYHRAVISQALRYRWYYLLIPRISSTAQPINWSAAKKKIAAMNTKAMTMSVDIRVSRLDGQVTLAVSDLTCWRKVKGLLVLDAICRS